MTVVPLLPVDPAVAATIGVTPTTVGDVGRQSFSDMLMAGVRSTNDKLVEADRLIAQFAVDDSIPLHQVTFALEEARISFELVTEIRNRALESYQQLMNMQI